MVGGGKARKNFSRKTRIVPAKKVGKKSSQKSAKTRFLYSHVNRDQEMGGKSAKQFFQRNTNSASKKYWEKNRLKQFENMFFIFTRIS